MLWASIAAFLRRTSRPAIAAVTFPAVALMLQHAFWPVIYPVSWFLAYPAVFFSSWMGGLSSGLVATILSAALEWWFFVAPVHVIVKGDPREIARAAAFICMGILFSLFHQRLRTSMRKTAAALAEREKSETALSRSEAALRRAQSIAKLGNWSLDLKDNSLEWSQELARIFGRGHEERPSWQELRAAIYDTDREPVGDVWSSALRGTPYDIEYRIVVDEQLRWVREIGQVELDRDRKPARAEGTLQDVTPRRVAQARLDRIYRANRALSKCNQALVRATEERTLLQQICDIVVQDAGYPLCWVGQAEQDEARSVRVLAQSSWRTGYLTGIRVSWADSERGQGPTGTCIRTGEIVTARDIAAEPGMAPWREAALRYGYASSLAIPLVVETQIFGAITIYAPEADAFGHEEVELLAELASDLAFGIATLRTRTQRAVAEEALRALNAELEERVRARTAELRQAREREGDVGRRIQETLLLDQPPQHIPSLRVAALSLPTERIDGDFYAFIEASESSLDLMIGDVMGKGVPAALLGAATKTQFLKALGNLTLGSGPNSLPQPEEIVTHAHTGLAKKLIELESFVTLCYARIDTRARQMQFVDCGHTGVIHFDHAAGQPEVLHGDHLPLGVREDEVFQQTVLPIGRGDLLVFFSDGITEARNPAGDLFGIGRLLEIIRVSSHLEPAELIQAVRAAVTEFCACEHLGDDLTIVLVRVEEVGDPIAREEITIASNLEQLQALRKFVGSFCAGPPLPLFNEDAICQLTLAANEVASNIMKHAYHGCPDRSIAVEVEAWPDRIVVRLRHQGMFFLPPDPAPPPETSRESGFGLYMLSRLVDEVHYYRDGRGRNCIALVKRANRTRAFEARNHGDPG